MRTLLLVGLMLGAVASAHAAFDSTKYVGNEKDLTQEERVEYHKLSGADAQAYLNTRGYYHRCLRARGDENPKLDLKDLKLRPTPFKFDLLSDDEQDTYNGVISDWINLRLNALA